MWLFGPVTESAIVIHNSETLDLAYECNLTGNSECFVEATKDQAITNLTLAQSLIDRDVTGIFTEELEEVVTRSQKLLDAIE